MAGRAGAARGGAPGRAGGAGADGRSGPTDELDAIAARLDRLACESMTFWLEYGVDDEHGGFHGTLDREGRAIEPTEKTSIQQSRHLWTLSTWHERREGHERRERGLAGWGDPARAQRVRSVADATYDFVVRALVDPTDGEVWRGATRDGRVTDRAKQLYAQSFAIFGLSTYGRAFDLEMPRKRALRCFRSIDDRAHDAEHGGYDQRGDPGWLAEGAEKGTNTHIHLLEAFTALYDATRDGRVRDRLAELCGLVATRLAQAAGYVHKEFLADWTPHGEPEVSYGHDLETAWLLIDALRALGGGEADGSTDTEVASVRDTVRDAARRVGMHASEHGFDAEAGGYFLDGVPNGAPTDREKVWWVQVEALAGLWWTYRLTGNRVHLDRLIKTLDWLEAHWDAPHGEWFWEVAQDGTPGERGTDKGNAWKTSYHGVRALVFTADWARAVLA